MEFALPEQFLKRMQALMSADDFSKLLASYSNPRYKGIRTNTLKCDDTTMRAVVPFDTEPVPWCPTGYYIDADVRPGKNPAYYAGLYYVQEPTAMTSAEALAPEPGDWVLDLCAAPGGKTTQLACKLQGKGLLVANELVVNRSAILASNVERMGIEHAVITNEFPERLVDGFYECFDKVLVDAPCSGEGMFRKEPAALSEWSEERVERCASRQLKILETVDKLIKPGGVMVYSTCTFAPEENEQAVEAFLANGRYVTEPIDLNGLTDHGRPEWTIHQCQSVADTLRVMPYHVQGEGHFVARLRKVASCEDVPPKKRKPKKGQQHLKKAGKKDISDFLAFQDQYLGRTFSNLYISGERLYSLPDGLEPWRLEGVKVLRAGLHLGNLKKNRFEPSHTLAMALKASDYKQVYHVADDEEAYIYLKGEPIANRDTKGWTLVCWQGHPLGFGKASQGMIKNHFPKGLRIMKK